MTGLLGDQVAVVTGAARGQGRSHALALAKEGTSIIALDACAPIATVPYPLATKADLETTAEQVEALGSRVIYGVVDVRDLAELDQFIRACQGGQASDANFESAYPFAETILLGTIALRVNKKLKWNSAKFEFANSEEANALKFRKNREGWEI